MQLSVSKDGFIHFGDTVMLLSPENKKSPTENYSAACGNLTLAVNPDDITVHTSESLQVPCGVSAVKSVNPVGRNAFHILRCGVLHSVDSVVVKPLFYGLILFCEIDNELP